MSRFVLLGHPVAHSLSPAIHAAAYRALGLPHRYELCDCPSSADLERALRRIRSGEVAGANVTVPYKAHALALADRADSRATETGAANVLVLEGSELVAYNTDASALSAELALYAPGATAAVIFGAGGAARAAMSACRERGFRDVFVVARNVERSVLARLGAVELAWPAGAHAAAWVADAVSATDVLIQATSLGMTGGPPGERVAELVPWERVPSSALAYDVVYTPAVTPFLRAARAHGLSAVGGLGMLVGQAAQTFAQWLGVEPPVEAMRQAAEDALAARAGGQA